MPQVPGIPDVIPQVQPYERPVPLPGVEAPPEAFGAGVSRAIQTFGGDVEKASDEVFSRALALRQLQVEGKLRDLTTQYYNEVAPIQNDFLTQEGENASPSAMQDHLAKIDQVRQKYAGMAAQYGPYGVNTFGADSASLNRGFTVEATRWSASQTRVAQVNSIDAQIAAHRDQARSGLLSEDDAATKLADLEQQRGRIKGLSQDQVTQNTKDAISGSLAERAKGQIIRDPINGIKSADALVNSGRLNGKDADSLVATAEHNAPAAAERWRQGAINGQDTSFGDRKVSVDRLVNAIFANEGHTMGPLVTRGRYAGQRALPGGVMPGNLAPWLKEAGMPPMTPEEYAADRNAQRQLMAFKLNQFQEQTGSANGAASMWFTGKPLDQAGFKVGDGWHTNAWYISNFNQALAKSASMNEFTDIARDAGNRIASTIVPNTGEIFAEHSQGKWIHQKQMDNYAKYDLHTQVDSWIMDNAGKTYDDFLADPRSAAWLDQAKQADPGFALRIPSMINSHNRATQQQTHLDHLRDLYVMYDDDHEKFMSMNPWEDKLLSFSDQVKIAKLQGDLHRQGTSDPNFNRAYSDLAAMYKTTATGGEIPDKSTDPQGYAAYKGDLYIAMQAYQENTKQPIKFGTPEGNKALQEIHHMLMTKVAGTPMYLMTEVPEQYADMARKADPQATDDEIRYAWFKQQSINQFNQLHQARVDRYARIRGEFRPGAIRGTAAVPGVTRLSASVQNPFTYPGGPQWNWGAGPLRGGEFFARLFRGGPPTTAERGAPPTPGERAVAAEGDQTAEAP